LRDHGRRKNDDERDLRAIRDERDRGGKKLKNRISSRFALISKLFFGPKDLKREEEKRKRRREEFFFLREFFLVEPTTTPTKEILLKNKRTDLSLPFSPFHLFLLKT
jgi:hypothetical protein